MSSLKLCLQRISPAFPKSSLIKLRHRNKFCSNPGLSSINIYNDKDPSPLFFDGKVQEFLKNLTGMNLEKIFLGRSLNYKDKLPQYKLFTEEDLKEHMSESLKDAEKLLQMPPVIKERAPITDVISFDPELQGDELTNKIIFTDITYGISDRKRLIVVRDTDGNLRHASWDERHRVNEIYNPKPGRHLEVPKAFTDENNFNSLLTRDEFRFILDQACAHYEPDDPDYQSIAAKTYEYINKRSKQDTLHSTRHYGPFCFYLAWNKKIDNLLIKYINNENLADASTLIKLFHRLNPESKSVNSTLNEEDPLPFIKEYTESDSISKPNLVLCIQAYEDLQAEKERQAESIKASQGL